VDVKYFFYNYTFKCFNIDIKYQKVYNSRKSDKYGFCSMDNSILCRMVAWNIDIIYISFVL